MSDHPYKYLIQLNAGGGYAVNSEAVIKYDLEQVRTEASIVAEIFGRTVTVYSVPTYGSAQWQVLEHVKPPEKKNEDEDE